MAMASRLLLQLRRSLIGGGLPLPDGGGISRPLVGLSRVGGWAGRPHTGRLDFPGAGRFYSGSGSGGQSSAWYDLEYTDFVAALLPVFIVDRFQKYKSKKQLQRLESDVEELFELSQQIKNRTGESK